MHDLWLLMARIWLLVAITYHGPKRELGFAPKIHPEDFKCAFTTAEGWGSYSKNK